MHPSARTPSPLESLLGLLRLTRPRQWIKNAFVLAPLLFTGQFLNVDAIATGLFAVLVMCLASASVYIVNDLNDIERDRLHAEKSKRRPLANGSVSPAQAFVLLAILYVLLAVAYGYHSSLVCVAVAYMVLNLLYSLWLKHQPILDIFTIAIGFVLRVYAGAVALEVPLSAWMFVTTFCLALYLAAIKRRQELLGSGDTSRQVLKHYSPELINRYAEMSATGAVLFYSLFVMNAHPKLVISIPLVLFGLFRYWFIVENNSSGESPTDALLGDWQLLATVALWTAAIVIALWP